MEKFFREQVGATVFILDLSDTRESPYVILSSFLNQTLARSILFPAYQRGQYVLLHVYCTGHGYMDKDNQSQILLNMPIYFHSKTTVCNPFPIEDELKKHIFTKLKNVCIVFIADICREENNFLEVYDSH